MRNIKCYNKFNEELFDKLFSKGEITVQDIESTGRLDEDTVKHPDYSATLRFALSNLNSTMNQNGGDRGKMIEAVTNWINDITSEYKNISNSTMSAEYEKHLSVSKLGF
jgi:hypothetical protein